MNTSEMPVRERLLDKNCPLRIENQYTVLTKRRQGDIDREVLEVFSVTMNARTAIKALKEMDINITLSTMHNKIKILNQKGLITLISRGHYQTTGVA